MSNAEVEPNSGMMSTSESLNKDLLIQLVELSGGEHATSECWSSAKSTINEALYWIALGAILWIATLLVIA
jgi:hypothetical protein